MNTLTIAHQDGDVTFALKRGGYLIEDGHITISIETEVVGEGFPDCALFCLVKHPLRGKLKVGDTFEAVVGIDSDEDVFPAVHAYFGFHATSVRERWRVMDVGADHVVFEFEADHDDVNYYDERAKRTFTAGMFKLSEKSQKELWIPS